MRRTAIVVARQDYTGQFADSRRHRFPVGIGVRGLEFALLGDRRVEPGVAHRTHFLVILAQLGQIGGLSLTRRMIH